MTDDGTMRLRLQQVAAYRELCRGVRRSGRENIIFALIMLGLAYFMYDQGFRGEILVLYGILAVGELLVGLYKWLVPSAEGVLLDGLVLLIFALFNLGYQVIALQAGRPLSMVIVFLGVFMLLGAVGRFRAYGVLRTLFGERPSPEHLAWFDELIREIHGSNPETDDLTLDLPTGPHWKVKLLGSSAFFVALKGGNLWIAGPGEFEILREKQDHGTGRRKGLLRVLDQPYPEFEISDATWTNYQKWRAANPLSQSPPTAVGGQG